MPASFHKYNPERDFIRVRDFLAHTYNLTKSPYNWRIERWNYARYFVAPMLGDPNPAHSRKNIVFWESTNGIWENQFGEIVGVVTCEHPDPSHPGFGEAFIQRRPDCSDLLPEMLAYAEHTFLDRQKRTLSLYIYDHDQEFKSLVQNLGYRLDREHPNPDSLYAIQGRIPGTRLPPGYELKSMADHSDLENRRKIFGLSFNHPDPADWPSRETYKELQKAPDYRKELDLYVIAPDGEYISCCIMWYDRLNQIGVLEPVGTHPEYRRKGFGKVVVLESIRRVAALGADRVWVGSGLPFYQAIGFKQKLTAYPWRKQF